MLNKRGISQPALLVGLELPLVDVVVYSNPSVYGENRLTVLSCVSRHIEGSFTRHKQESFSLISISKNTTFTNCY